METFLPDLSTREAWKRLAEREAQGSRAKFWRSVPSLPPRPDDAHKGTFGTALLVGGSRGMAGAIGLAGAAAVVAGAGLTRLCVPDPILETVAGYDREYTTIPCPSDAQGRFSDAALDAILDAAASASAVGIGPGLGRSPALDRIVAELFFELTQPAVFDADALNALASAGVFGPDAGKAYVGRVPKGARVLTPHPGEFKRLAGFMPSDDRDDRKEASETFFKNYVAAYYGRTLNVDKSRLRPTTLLLKGHDTVVTELRFPSAGGHRIAQSINFTGNSNLATGGSGDVLTGLVVGLAAQGAPAADAARIAAALHGEASELRWTLCKRGATAGDIVRFIPPAFDYYMRATRACEAE